MSDQYLRSAHAAFDEDAERYGRARPGYPSAVFDDLAALVMLRPGDCLLEVSIERLLLVVESIASRNTNTIRGERVPWNELRFFFLCRPRDGSQEAGLPDVPEPRQTGVRWVPLERLPSEPVLPQVSRELIAAALEPGKYPLVVPNPHD